MIALLATVGLTLVCLVALFCFLTPLSAVYLASILLLTSAALIGLVGFRMFVRWRKGAQPLVNLPSSLPGKLETILPSPLPEGTFPVHVVVRFKGVLTGTDFAAANFVEGWLHVEGVRASFALRAGDACSEWRKGTTLRIGFLDGQSVDLWIVEGQRLEAHFRHAATLWIADREHPEGESILPPLEAQAALRWGRCIAFLIAIGVPGLVLMVDTLLGHRLTFFWTFSIWSLGLLIALRLVVVERRLHQASAKSKTPSVLSRVDG